MERKQSKEITIVLNLAESESVQLNNQQNNRVYYLMKTSGKPNDTMNRRKLSYFKEKLSNQIRIERQRSQKIKQIAEIYDSINIPKSTKIIKQKEKAKLPLEPKAPIITAQITKKENETELHIKKQRNFRIFKSKLLRITSFANLEDEQYTKLQLLGQGGSSYVFLVLDNTQNTKLVMKEYKRQSRKVLKQFLIGKSLDHDNLPKYYSYKQNRIFMEYIEPTRQTCSNLQLAYQLAKAIQYLHRNQICHTDIKPKNLIITHKNKLKLIDFGNSLRQQLWKKGKSGTFGYMAPEMLDEGEWNGREVDIWSFGVVCHQWRLVHLAEFCMVDRKHRPKIEQVLTHPIFINILYNNKL